MICRSTNEGTRPARVAAAVAVFLALAGSLTSQEVLTNERIVSMSKARLGDKVIVEMIQSSPGKYVVTSAALIALKQQGVSDEVIAAMRAKTAKRTEAAPVHRKSEPEPEPQGSQLPPFGKWQVYDQKDEIAGESHVEGFLRERAQSNGREGEFQVTATCPSLGLAFKIVYLSSFDKDLGYKMEDGNFLLRRPHVVMRLNLDGNPGSAPSTTSDFKNEATLWFQRAMTDKEKGDLGTAVLGGLLSITSPAEPKDIYRAKSLKVELPLNNGDRPILNIRPQEAGFPDFVSRCQAADQVRQRKSDEEKQREDAAAAAAKAEQQKADAAQLAKRQQASVAANDLKVERDLGDALVCKGSQLYAQSPALFPYTAPRSLEAMTLVKIVGASVQNGVLWNEVRVKPISDRRWPVVNPFGLGPGAYFVSIGAIKDSCPNYQPRTPGLFSGDTLTAGVREAGTLDAWSRELAQNAERAASALAASAIPAGEFPAALTASLQKRAGEFGVDVAQYRTAVQTVAEIVNLCSSISRSDYAGSKDSYGIPHLVRFKDGKYRNCVATGVWRGVPDGKGIPGFLIRFDLDKRWQREKNDWNGPKLHIDVYWKETRPVAPAINSISEYERLYLLLSVDIKDRSESARTNGQPLAFRLE